MPHQKLKPSLLQYFANSFAHAGVTVSAFNEHLIFPNTVASVWNDEAFAVAMRSGSHGITTTSADSLKVDFGDGQPDRQLDILLKSAALYAQRDGATLQDYQAYRQFEQAALQEFRKDLAIPDTESEGYQSIVDDRGQLSKTYTHQLAMSYQETGQFTEAANYYRESSQLAGPSANAIKEDVLQLEARPLSAEEVGEAVGLLRHKIDRFSEPKEKAQAQACLLAFEAQHSSPGAESTQRLLVAIEQVSQNIQNAFEGGRQNNSELARARLLVATRLFHEASGWTDALRNQIKQQLLEAAGNLNHNGQQVTNFVNDPAGNRAPDNLNFRDYLTLAAGFVLSSEAADAVDREKYVKGLSKLLDDKAFKDSAKTATAKELLEYVGIVQQQFYLTSPDVKTGKAILEQAVKILDCFKDRHYSTAYNPDKKALGEGYVKLVEQAEALISKSELEKEGLRKKLENSNEFKQYQMLVQLPPQQKNQNVENQINTLKTNLENDATYGNDFKKFLAAQEENKLRTMIQQWALTSNEILKPFRDTDNNLLKAAESDLAKGDLGSALFKYEQVIASHPPKWYQFSDNAWANNQEVVLAWQGKIKIFDAQLQQSDRLAPEQVRSIQAERLLLLRAIAKRAEDPFQSIQASLKLITQDPRHASTYEARIVSTLKRLPHFLKKNTQLTAQEFSKDYQEVFQQALSLYTQKCAADANYQKSPEGQKFVKALQMAAAACEQTLQSPAFHPVTRQEAEVLRQQNTQTRLSIDPSVAAPVP